LTIQLGFPTNFQDVYAVAGPALRFAPSQYLVAAPYPEGDDEQDQYHRQKMMDAHRRVMNGVADTRRGTQRALVSHQGYWMMPDAVLGQRVFANPSLGSGAADIYKPIHRDTPGLTGGVLRSRTGQTYGMKLLQNRISQLNAIDEAAAGLTEGMPMTDLSTVGAEAPGPGTFVKLNTLLNNLINALQSGVGGVSRYEAGDFVELSTLLFRVAPQADKDELSNLLEALDVASEAANETLQDLQEDQPDVAGAPGPGAFLDGGVRQMELVAAGLAGPHPAVGRLRQAAAEAGSGRSGGAAR
jgi:hypothetical protein